MWKWTIVFLLTFPITIYSQNLQPKSVATPEAASMDRFGNIPVSPYTGVPDISIPIYVVRKGGVEVPIVLRYHSSGVQVEQNATWVGLGWDLTPGGKIVQHITGMLDQDNNYPSVAASTYTNMISHAQAADNGAGMEFTNTTEGICVMPGCPGERYDMSSIQTLKSFNWGRPNMYQLSIPGGSAQFYLDPLTKLPVQCGKKNTQYAIQKATNTTGYQSEWTVKDDGGNSYFFSRTDNEFAYNTSVSQYYNGLMSNLTDIVSPNGESISFTYTDGKYQVPTYSQEVSFNSQTGVLSPGSPSFTIEYQMKYLTKIETETERVEFELSNSSAERSDLIGLSVTGGHGAKRLNAIHIWDKINNRKIRSILFSYAYFPCDLAYAGPTGSSSDYLTKRLKLTSVQFIGYENSGTAVTSYPPYTFNYDETYSLPRKDAYARDHWGFFNGQSANTGFLPNIKADILSGVLPIQDFAGERMPDQALEHLKSWGLANKGMKTEFAKAGILSKITYPTGGYTIFEYEANKFKNYRVFSADENNNGEGYLYTNLVDLNTSGSNALSPRIYPDANGKLDLYDFKGAFSRVNQNIHHTYFLAAWVKIWKIDASNNRTEVRSWQVTSDANAFHQANGSTFPPTYITLSGASTDSYEVETYLPNIPELTPTNGSLIPVASVSCSYSLKDPLTLVKESIGGGLRIAAITNYAGINEVADKTVFKYEKDDNVTSSGKLMSPLRHHSYVRHIYNATPAGNIYAYLYQLSSYSYVPISVDAQGAIVGYSRVTQAKVDPQGVNNGKTVYNFRNEPSTVFSTELGSFHKPLPTIAYLDNGLINSVEYHANSGLIKKTEYDYKYIERAIRRGIVLYDLVYGTPSDQSCFESNCTPGWWSGMMPYGKWLAVYYPINTKWFVPAETRDIDYSLNPGGQITLKNKYVNYNNLGQLTRHEVTNSNGEVITTDYQYPVDVQSPSALVQSMISKKLYHLMQGRTVSSDIKGYIQRQNYHYSLNANGNINVLKAARSNGSGAFFDVVDNVIYDTKDNVVQHTKNGSVFSYIWDYKTTLRVAQVENALLSDIAYTSFESDGTGTWSGINPLNVANAGAITGSRYYSQSPFSFSKSGLSAGQFIVSYWSKNGSYTVNSTTAVGGKTANGWTYFEHTVNSSGGSISITGSGAIDELRLYPKSAFMTTCTYFPLVGMSSACDDNNRVTYYEYDQFGKLFLIRDQDRNVVKKFCYNYAGQVASCPQSCSSIAANWQNTQTALRCQLSSGQNTGYQEQEQIDINPCSPTYNQTQWVLAGMNTTACPIVQMVSITYTNPSSSTGFEAVYTNTSTLQTYNFTIPGSGSGTLGSLPAGTYSLTISKPPPGGMSLLLKFGTGCQFETGEYSASFSNVNVTNCHDISIDYDW